MEKPDTNEVPILYLQTCLNQRSLAIQGPVFLIYFKIEVTEEMRWVGGSKLTVIMRQAGCLTVCYTIKEDQINTGITSASMIM